MGFGVAIEPSAVDWFSDFAAQFPIAGSPAQILSDLEKI
jgi:hypothetical protein